MAVLVDSIKTHAESTYVFSAFRAVHVDSTKTHDESAYGFSACRGVHVESNKNRDEGAYGFSLNEKYDEPLSHFASNFNFRR